MRCTNTYRRVQDIFSLRNFYCLPLLCYRFLPSYIRILRLRRRSIRLLRGRIPTSLNCPPKNYRKRRITIPVVIKNKRRKRNDLRYVESGRKIEYLHLSVPTATYGLIWVEDTEIDCLDEFCVMFPNEEIWFVCII